MIIRIGSRKSQLALAQTHLIKEQIENWGQQNNKEIQVEIITFDTKGDQILDISLSKIGDKGLFTKELEIALENKDIDLAVHSLKDLPTKDNQSLPIAAISKREKPWDCVVFNPKHKDHTLATLPEGSIIGTSSIRRIAQLKNQYPHLEFETLRGNINTRLKKISDPNNNFAAGILALAGLERLNLQSNATETLTIDKCIPAPGQGALAIQTHVDLSNHEDFTGIFEYLNDEETEYLVKAERIALETIDGGCQTPFGAYAEYTSQETIKLIACLIKDNKLVRIEEEYSKEKHKELGKDIGSELLRLTE